MKFAIVSGLNESQSSETQILESFTKRCEFLKNMNYQGIELAILEPERIPVKCLKEVADSFQLEIPALGTGSTYLRLQYSLGDLHLRIREKAIERLKRYMEFATVSNSKVIIGLIRGRYSAWSNSTIENRNLTNSLRKCCELAEDYNVELVFEPINRFEIDSYNKIQDSVGLLEKLASDKLKLLIDSFHLHLEEDPFTIWSYLASIAQKVAHLHIADDTRRAPGTGHFNFQRFLTLFEENHYQGFASVEAIMVPSFEEVAQETMNYLKSLNLVK